MANTPNIITSLNNRDLSPRTVNITTYICLGDIDAASIGNAENQY